MPIIVEWFGALGLWFGAVLGFLCVLLFIRTVIQFPARYAEMRRNREENHMDEFYAELAIQILFGSISIFGTVLFLPVSLYLIKYGYNILSTLQNVTYK